MDHGELERLRAKYGGSRDVGAHDPKFRRVADFLRRRSPTHPPYAGMPTLLSAAHRPQTADGPDLAGLQIGLVGVPMDLGASNRPGARFGPRALRTIERIGPYNPGLDCVPLAELVVADIGDVPFRSRYSLESCLQDIEQFFTRLVVGGVAPLAVGGDHSISQAILRAVGRDRPVGMIHIDAHCDTDGAYEGTRFHHGGPFRNAVLDGVLDPRRSVQIGIRGSADYLWEFSRDAGMTVITAPDFHRLGGAAVIETARSIVGDGPVYLTFDIDGLDPAFAPGTGTPEIGGLSSADALRLLQGLKGLDIVGGDVVEVAPQYDPTTNTAQAAAQMLFEILSLMVWSPSLGSRPSNGAVESR